MEHLNRTHPRDKNEQPYGFYDAACKYHTGSNCLWSTDYDKDIDEFGLGMSVYFKFLKSTLWLIFFVTLMNVILFVVYDKSKLNLFNLD